MSDLTDLGPVGSRHLLYLLGEDGPRVVPSQALCIAPVHHREPEVRVDPPGVVPDVLGVDGQAGGQGEAPCLGDLPEAVELRPGSFGVDMVGGYRRDATPVVDAGVQDRTEVVREVGWGLEVDLGREDQAGESYGLEVLVGRAGRCRVHRRARLGQEVLDYDLLDVSVAAMRYGYGLQGCDAVGTPLADPYEDSGGERDRQPTGGLEGLETPLRVLVWGPAVAVEVRTERLHHHPL